MGYDLYSPPKSTDQWESVKPDERKGRGVNHF